MLEKELEKQVSGLPAQIQEMTIACASDAAKVVEFIQTAMSMNDEIDKALGERLKEADKHHKALKKTIDTLKAPADDAVKIGKKMLLAYRSVDDGYEKEIKGLSFVNRPSIDVPDDDEFLYTILALIAKKKLPLGLISINTKVLEELHNMGTLKLHDINLSSKDNFSVTIRRA